MWLHPLDRGKVLWEPWWQAAQQKVLRLTGVPDAVQTVIRQTAEAARSLAPAPAQPLRELADGIRIPFDGFELHTVWTPGHCLGHISLWWEAEAVLFGGDLLLDGISPNPLPEPLLEGGHALFSSSSWTAWTGWPGCPPGGSIRDTAR